ncbi:hypothetical protein GCM10025884_04270 [Leuconostoc gelidum subsp. gelidum]|nr:hypothetical protein GCM10025884_04270 [Leuconostoc gelidum subsp. gelidum]
MFQAVRTENGVIVERDVRTYDTFDWIDARVRALSSFLGGDWGFEVIYK